MNIQCCCWRIYSSHRLLCQLLGGLRRNDLNDNVCWEDLIEIGIVAINLIKTGCWKYKVINDECNYLTGSTIRSAWVIIHQDFYFYNETTISEIPFDKYIYIYQSTKLCTFCTSAPVISSSCISSVWPVDAIWRHRPGSTLGQVMVCCLTTSTHCLILSAEFPQ